MLDPTRSPRFTRGRAGLAAAAAAVFVACASAPAPQTETREILSPVYTIDRIYKSMQGPAETIDLTLGHDSTPELIWITGYHAEVVAPDGESPVPPEFMCHSNLGLEPADHADRLGWKRKRTSSRLFTVSQGQTSVVFPPGFGIPIYSDETLHLTTQVLNHNVPDTSLQARVKVTIDFVRDRNARRMVPLYMKSANALVSLDDHDGHFGFSPETADDRGSPAGMAASSRVIEDVYGRRFAGHWVVPPGEQTQTTPVTHWMNLPGDATVHYIAAHLHPFARELTLRDATTDQVIFTSDIDGYDEKIGLRRVEAFSSVDGLRLHADHEFTLTSVYNNTSGVPQEAMAVMYMYLRDEEFGR